MGAYRMRGTRMRGRRKLRVGARTVNFASIGLVASALIVVVEVTAPSSAPPGVFASGPHRGGPDLPPTLPLETTAPVGVRVPASQVLFGGLTLTSSTSASTSIATAAPASSIGPGLTVPGLSPSGVWANTELLTPAAPAAAQRSHEKGGKAARRSPAVAAAGSQSNGADKTLENSSESAKAGVAAANPALQPSPNVTVGNGNGNANANANGNNGNANANGNGHADNGHADNGHANGHASGPPVTSQAPAPPPLAPPVPSHGIGAGQPPGRGAGAGHSH